MLGIPKITQLYIMLGSLTILVLKSKIFGLANQSPSLPLFFREIFENYHHKLEKYHGKNLEVLSTTTKFTLLKSRITVVFSIHGKVGSLSLDRKFCDFFSSKRVKDISSL
jgi:predicted peptidase